MDLEFDLPTRADWESAASKILKGAELASLNSRTDSGLLIEPIYEAADQTVLTTGRGAVPWSIAQRVDHPDAGKANASALSDLEGGTSMLTLVTQNSPLSYGHGLTLNKEGVENFGSLFENVHTDLIQLQLCAGAQAIAVFKQITEHLAKQPQEIHLGLDPAGLYALSIDGATETGDLKFLSDQINQGSTVFTCSGALYHDRGANATQEIALIAATGVAYLEMLLKQGFTIDQSARLVSALITVDNNQFEAMAKLAAFRAIWSRILEVSGASDGSILVHAQTSWRMLARDDAHSNLLRNTIAASAAALAGANSICVLPHSLCVGLPNDFSRRTARNIQNVLMEESQLHRVDQPARGSGALEAMTQAMSQSAWEQFQTIQNAGGIFDALKGGFVGAMLVETGSARAEKVAHARHSIVGVNEFAGDAVMSADIVEGFALPGAADAPRATLIPPAKRLSAPFESLRRRVRQLCDPQPVFLATFGSLASYGARATWVRNYLAIATLELEETDPDLDLDVLVATFKKSGASAVCLCASDANYAERATDIIKALKEAGARDLTLAGRVDDMLETLFEAGLDRTIYQGINLLDSLGELIDHFESHSEGKAR